MKPASKTLTLLAVIFLFGGCASKRLETTTFPEIGSVSTVGIGENLISQGTGKVETSLILANDETFDVITLKKGLYPFVMENSEIIKFVRDGKVIIFDKSNKNICIGNIKDGKCRSVKHSFDSRLSNKSKNGFQQNILYNGKIGNKIALGYREFSNNMARQAFSNEVNYDLSESTILGYKGARIEVLKATNTEITYRILSGFQ
jgi:hypothetical protein